MEKYMPLRHKSGTRKDPDKPDIDIGALCRYSNYFNPMSPAQ